MRTQFMIRLSPSKCAIADLVKWDIVSENAYIITRINVPYAFRGNGYGSMLLREILSEADYHSATLVLQVEPSGGMSVEDLTSWYSRYGFEVGKSRLMERVPGKPIPPIESGRVFSAKGGKAAPNGG